MKNKFTLRIGQRITPPHLRKLKTDIVHCASCIVHQSKTLTILLGLVLSSNLWAATKTLIVDGSKLTSTATTAAADYTYGDFTITMSDGAKYQSSSGSNKFADKAILIGKSGKYIYNKTPFNKITKFEIYANKGASTKVSVGVVFSTTAISAYAAGTNTYTATLSTEDKVYDCSSKIPEGAKYFWYQVTNANNSQVMFKVTYEEGDTPTEPVAPAITTQPEGASYEKDATATALTIAASGTPTPTYQWYSNTTESTSGASLISGATNASYTPSTATISTKYYYCVATNTEGSATSDIVAVTVTAALPKITITKTSSGITTSYGSSTFTQNEVTFAYTDWMSSTDFIQAKASTSPSLQNTTAMPGKITKIQVVTGSGKTARAVTIKAGTTSTVDNMVSITSPTTSMDMVFDFGETNYTYFCLSTPGNACYFDKIVISYEELAPTNEAVTFAAPEGGSLVIKNGATPIATGANIQDGTVLDVTFGMTPAEAYKDVAIKVTNTSTNEDVTEKVYDATKKQITMPRYAITVAVTSTKLYKISLTTAGEGEGTATMNDVTTDIYVDGETQIDLLASAVAPNEFTKWSATEKILINEENEAETYAYASGDGTITATFGISSLQPLGTPTLSDPTNITYTGVTLNWQELANAEAYNVELLLNDETVASDVIIGETTWTPAVTLQANTTYTYTVQGVGDGTTYAVENNPKAQSTFNTADYPAATLTLSENGVETPVNGKLNTPIDLPTASTQACDGKVFVGWSENAIEGEAASATLLDGTYTFTEPSVLAKTIYAVYAKEEKGTTTWNKVPTNYTDWIGNEFLIVYESEATKGYVMKQADAVTNYVEATIASGVIASKPTDAMSVIIEKFGTTDDYQLKVAGVTPASYLKGKSDNGLSFDASAQQTTISYDNTNGWLISNNSSWLRYNTTSGQTRFRFYKSTTYTGSSYKTIQFYKKTAGESTYSNYCTTCQAAIAVPTFSLAEGEYNEAKTLTLSAAEGDIYYTINEGAETKYTAAIALNNRGTYEISAYAKVDDRESETVTKTYTLDWPYTLDELAASDVVNGTTVQVTFENKEITNFYTNTQGKRYGIYVNVQKGGKDVEIYCNKTEHPNTWEVGGKVSSTQAISGTWTYYSDGSQWEFCPNNWENISYTAPAKITSLVIDGDVNNKNYTAGQKLDFTGLTVTGVYSDETEEDVTEEVSWTEVTLTENQETATAIATLNNAKTGNVAVSQTKTITGLTVGAAKTLQSIYVADDSQHKDAFFVGRPFSAEGLKVMAHYNMGDDQQIAVANLTITNTTFSEAEAEHAISISYTENDVEKTTSYNVEVKYMNLSDLVAATDINDHDHVYVKFENVMISDFYSTKGIYLNVQKGDKDIEIYNPSTNYPNTWAKYGTVSATLDDVEWTDYNGTWELKPSSWEGFSYTAPNIPVTSMEISPAEVSVGEAKTTTLSIVYTPEHATNTGVTWAVTEGSDYASVDAETGVVTGIKAGTATITATLTADPTITATRTVTVTETAKCEISYYVKSEVASTQQIAREEEGSLTYVPTLEVAGYTFAGWAEDAIAEETATATLISTYTPAADEATKSVYAIFKRVDDSSPTYQKYAKVTSALTDWAGDYLLVYEDEGTAYVWTGVDAASCNVSTTIDGNVISSKPDGAASLTIAAMTDGYSIQVKGGTNDGKYIGKNATGNGMDIGASAYKNTISFSENSAVITGSGGSKMRYNSSSDQKRFRYYGSGQKAVQLYKYDAGSVMYTSNPVAKVKVTFNLDGGVGGCGTITVNEGENAVLCEDAPTKDLNKFKAWSDGENEYAPGATIENVTEDIELTALWIAKRQYTITFNKAGAAGTTPASITDYEYNVVTLPAQGDLSNPGYVFSGWNDGETTHAGGATFTMPEKNVSMTAVWVAKTNDKWVLVTSTNQLVAGSKYVITNNENDAVAGDITGPNAYMNKVDATFSDNKQFITAMAGQVELTLGGSTDAWTFAKDASNYLANSGTNLSWSTTASTWKIAFEDDKMTIVEGESNSLQYNTSSPRFKTYTSSQAAVQLYVLVPAKTIDEEVNASTLDEQADVTVNEGGNLVIDENIELGDIVVMEGGKVTLQTTTKLTVNNFVIKSTMAGGESGQVIGVTESNFTITGSAYYDVVLGDEGNPDKWHAFAVPFNVDAINGVYDLDDNKLTNEVNYAIMDYHGDVRAQGQYGWKKFRGIMTPGTFYLMTVDGLRTTYRMKMKDGFHASSSTISVQQYAKSDAGTIFDAGWNGIANNQLSYSSVGVNVQVLNPATYTYEVMTASTYNFTVGTPFFYQASADGSVEMAAANGSNPNYAPRRVGATEIKDVNVMLSNNNYTDHLYLSATDEATAEYQIGRDLVKMTMTATPSVPQIFALAYNTALCMVDAPMTNDEAQVSVRLYAPASGEYTLSVSNAAAAEVYLLRNGMPVWNLSESAYTLDLEKGNTEGYSLRIRRAHKQTTDMDAVNGSDKSGVQKVIMDNQLYIIFDGQTFNAVGQMVK